jgi:hypothetical protein
VLEELLRMMKASPPRAVAPPTRFSPADVLASLATQRGGADPLALCVRITGLGFHITNFGKLLAEVRLGQTARAAFWGGELVREERGS